MRVCSECITQRLKSKQNVHRQKLFRMRVKFLEIEIPLESVKPEIIFRPFMFRVKLKLTGNSVQIVLY